MLLQGVSLAEIKMRGRWKSDAVFSYLTAYVMDNRPCDVEGVTLADVWIVSSSHISKRRGVLKGKTPNRV
jgi:hypothetical protein